MEKALKYIGYGPITGIILILISIILFFVFRDASYYFFVLGLIILIFSKNENKIELRKDINSQNK